MGCDIHLNLEYKITVNNETKWRDGNLYELDPYEEKYIKSFFKNEKRNYKLFSILADVRNYGNMIKPIAEAKGLPDNMSPTVKALDSDWGCDAHTHSYLTLKELLEVEPNYKKIKVSGIISKQQQEDLDNKGIVPTSWCQGTTQKDYDSREWTMEFKGLSDLIAEIKDHYDRIFYYGYNWDNDYKTYAEDIRIVFWFDN
jgi:hypothetical protein